MKARLKIKNDKITIKLFIFVISFFILIGLILWPFMGFKMASSFTLAIIFFVIFTLIGTIMAKFIVKKILHKDFGDNTIYVLFGIFIAFVIFINLITGPSKDVYFVDQEEGYAYHRRICPVIKNRSPLLVANRENADNDFGLVECKICKPDETLGFKWFIFKFNFFIFLSE